MPCPVKFISQGTALRFHSIRAPERKGRDDIKISCCRPLPGLLALTTAGTGFAEVGGAAIAAFGGEPSTSDSGILGTLQFAITENFSGAAFIALTNALYRTGDTQEEFDLYTFILLGKNVAPPLPDEILGKVTLDLDLSDQDQGNRELGGVTTGQAVEIQIYAKEGAAGISGYSATIEFDPNLISYSGFVIESKTGMVGLPNISRLAQGEVVVGGALLGGAPVSDDSLPLGLVTFETTEQFSDRATITLTNAEYRKPGGVKEGFELRTIVLLTTESSGPTADFDLDGDVDFDDFFAFALAFNSNEGEPRFDSKFDLDGDKMVGFGDFFEFAAAFGTKPAAAKPAGLGEEGANEEARLTLHVQHSDRQDRFDVDLLFKGAESLRGYGATLQYDPGSMEFLEAKPTGVFERGDVGWPFLQVSDGVGEVILGDVLPSGVVSEEGVLTRLSFRVRPGGNIGSLRLVDGLLLDGRGLTNRVGVAGLDRDKLVPLSYGLSQNFPNPFNATTQVFYQIPEDGRSWLSTISLVSRFVSLSTSKFRQDITRWPGMDTMIRDEWSRAGFICIGWPSVGSRRYTRWCY